MNTIMTTAGSRSRFARLHAALTRQLHVQADLQARYVYDLGASGRQACATMAGPAAAEVTVLERLCAADAISPGQRQPRPVTSEGPA